MNLIFRGDSGFCRWRMMRWCNRNGVYCVLGLPRNARLERMAQPWAVPAERNHKRHGDKQRLFGAIGYAAGSWGRTRRVIVKAEHSERGANPRCIATNLPGDEQELYDDLYRHRGDMAHRIKEQQLGLFADRTSCHDFLANQFRVLLAAAAYVLLETLRRVGLAGTELATAQATTIRLNLLKIGGRIVRSVRRIVIHLASGYPSQALFHTVLHNLHEWRSLLADDNFACQIRPHDPSRQSDSDSGGKGVVCADLVAMPANTPSHHPKALALPFRILREISGLAPARTPAPSATEHSINGLLAAGRPRAPCRCPYRRPRSARLADRVALTRGTRR